MTQFDSDSFNELVINVCYAYHEITIAAKIGDPNLCKISSEAHTITWNKLREFVNLQPLGLSDQQKVKNPYED
jgi:hypothetical protein